MENTPEELPIHPKGILIKSARIYMWCVRIEEDLYAASKIEKLLKWLSNPDAKVGAWIEVKWVESEGLNKTKDRKTKGFMDLLTGEFYKQDKNKFGREINAWTGKKAVEHSRIFKKVSELMLEKWQKRFEVDQRV
jgi:hypothetical protein